MDSPRAPRRRPLTAKVTDTIKSRQQPDKKLFIPPQTYGALDRREALIYSSFSDDFLYKPHRIRHGPSGEPVRRGITQAILKKNKDLAQGIDGLDQVQLARNVHKCLSKGRRVAMVRGGASMWDTALQMVETRKPFPLNPAASEMHQWRAVRKALQDPMCRATVTVPTNANTVPAYFRAEDAPMVQKAVQKFRAMTARSREDSSLIRQDFHTSTTPVSISRPSSAPLTRHVGFGGEQHPTHWQTVRCVQGWLDVV